MKVCICGGGSLGHVCAGVLSSRPGIEVSLLTGHPEEWGEDIDVQDPFGKTFHGHLSGISSDAASVIPGQDMILLCLPGGLIEQTLVRIKPFIGNAAVGSIVSSTGFFFFAHDILGTEAPIFGFQRVPFISRVAQYGISANLLGYKSSLLVAMENIAGQEEFLGELERMFLTPVGALDNFYEAALTNSNPILHTGRLFTMFKGHESDVFDHNVLFYKEWTDEASAMILDMDAEFFRLLDSLQVRNIPTLLDYYESTDPSSLTAKISSIPAFQPILSPMKPVDGGWSADFSSRYFTEDFPFGLRWIRDLAIAGNVPVPLIDKVYQWGIASIARYGEIDC